MPLDGHSYLVSQGWTGKGTGLRQGAISRPLAIPQKKNLAGLGKDRDEAFPFWDHIFSAAAKSIQLKVASDDDESDADSSVPEFKRTTTGILSNRRPVTGLSASTSGTSTPDEGSRSNLLSIAKREAAKRGLYARFFRGPVLDPDDDSPSPQSKAPFVEQTIEESTILTDKAREEEQDAEGSSKKRKRTEVDNAERRQRKKERRENRERREQKAKEKEEAKARRRDRKAAKAAGDKSSAEELERKEKRRRKRELKEKEREPGGDTDSTSKKEKKKKEKGESKEPTLPEVVGSDGALDAEKPGPISREAESNPQVSRIKKKRKRTDE
ncbi:hypothetical protein D9615_002916 [Tricholomella constricta]|uniref:G-patch domain-containing protein n=1 Tax=Tricholomella constricta TaxID=117010 RepID=A0A8H5M6L7_9AGAR|nr:hypothetical protein D9615_002916 [Tricholomella constricta]